MTVGRCHPQLVTNLVEVQLVATDPQGGGIGEVGLPVRFVTGKKATQGSEHALFILGIGVMIAHWRLAPPGYKPEAFSIAHAVTACGTTPGRELRNRNAVA